MYCSSKIRESSQSAIKKSRQYIVRQTSGRQRRRISRSLISEPLEARLLLTGIKADLLLDYHPTAPANGWQYLWNAPQELAGLTDETSGQIGDGASYEALLPTGNSYSPNGSASTNPLPAHSLRVMAAGDGNSIEFVPGLGTNQADVVDNTVQRHAIAAWTVPAGLGGQYVIRDSILRQTSGVGDGGSIHIQVNNGSRAYLATFDNVADTNFDVDLNVLQPGDTVYVAFGPRTGEGGDLFNVNFKLEQLDASPAATDDVVGVLADTPSVLDVLTNDYDPNGEALSIVEFTDAANGTVNLISGQLIYEANAGYIGDDSLSYTVQNETGERQTATVNLTVVGDDLQTLTYVAHQDSLVNPERGFMSIADSKQYNGVRDEGQSIVRMLVRGTDFRTQDLDAEFLQQIRTQFARARNSGLKVNFRFTYSEDKPDEPANAASLADASKEFILRHITQLQPIWNEFADVMFLVEAGFVGKYGEWHGSANGLTADLNPNNPADVTQDQQDIVNAILDAVPPNIPLALRTPSLKRAVFAGAPEADPVSTITAATAFDGSELSRVGHHNDCFLSSESDFGTYRLDSEVWPLSRELDYIGQESLYTLHGGETCDLHDRNDGSNAIAEMEQLHTDFLNVRFQEEVIARWQSGGVFDEIDRRLGYRFELTEATIAQQVKPSHVLPFSFVVQNSGFGELYGQRNVEVVLRNNATGEVWSSNLTEARPGVAHDPRFWSGGTTTLVEADFVVPESLASGTYSVGLRLADPNPELANDVRYAVQFADNSAWDQMTGTNFLTDSLVVSDEASSTINVAVTEATANESAGTMDFVVSLSDHLPPGNSVTVDFATTNIGTATAADDFTPVNRTIEFQAGQALTQVVSVPIIDDLSDEDAESITVQLSTGVGVAILPQAATATGTIVDNDTAGVGLFNQNVAIAEAGGTDTYQIALTSLPTGPVAVQVAGDSQSEVSTDGATFGPTATITLSDTSPTVITVRAVDDAMSEGVHSGTITHTIVGTVSDPKYPTAMSIASIVATIDDNDPAMLTLNIPNSSITEDGDSVMATVSRNTSLTNAVTLSLQSLSPTEATVGASSIVIPAGQRESMPFAINGVRDFLVDGIQTATIQASADNHTAAEASVDVTDVDVPTISLTFDAIAVSEASGTATATIKRNTPTDLPLTISLSSSDINEASVADSVEIPAGTDSATFTVTGIPDSFVDDDKTITVTATADGFPNATAMVQVTNVDQPMLSLDIAKQSISETNGESLATIQRNSDPSNALTVTISSDESEVLAPESVVILAGQLSVEFTVSGVDDNEADGNQVVSVTATTPGFESSVGNVEVIDDGSRPNAGNVDGDEDFDANDSFLIHLTKLAGVDQQIEQSKGASMLTAAEIRSNINSLEELADVDGDGDFDANDSFLIHLVKLSGTNSQIDQSKGQSPLTAVEIRVNVNVLGTSNSPSTESMPSRTRMAEFTNDSRATAEVLLSDDSDEAVIDYFAIIGDHEHPLHPAPLELSSDRNWIETL